MEENNATEEESKRAEAKESVEKDTGKSFEEMQELATKTLKIHNEAKIGREQEQQRTSAEEGQKIAEMSEKMKSSHLAEDLINAGVSREDYSIGATTLEHATQTVSEKISENTNSTASNSMDVIFVKFGDKTVPLTEFLQQPKETLTDKEQELQKSLGFIYDANSKEVLFQSFPNWRENQPLTIDTTEQPKTGGKETQGEYKPKDNTIHLAQDKTSIELLAHELKHAEQCGKEVFSKYDSITGKIPDALALHQLSFLEEAQAFAFGYYVKSLQFTDKSSPEFETEMKKTQGTLWPTFKEKLESGEKVSYKSMEKDLILNRLGVLYSSSYKDYYDSKALILQKDKGISTIPDSFHLDSDTKKEVQEKIHEMPKEARNPQRRFQQLLSDGNTQEAQNFLTSSSLSSKDLSSCLKISVRENNNEVAQKILSLRDTEGNLKIETGDLNKLFTERNGLWKDGKTLAELSPDVQQLHKNTSDAVLNTMLSLKTKDGSPVIQPSSIKDLENKTKSGAFLGIERPDLHSSIQKYKQAHPEDKRFSTEKTTERPSGLKSTLATLSKNGEKFSEIGKDPKQQAGSGIESGNRKNTSGLQSTLGILSNNGSNDGINTSSPKQTSAVSTPMVASVSNAKKQR